MRTAVRMVQEGSLEPGWYGSPASTLFALLSGAILVLQGAWHLLGDPGQSFWSAYHEDVTALFVAGRVIVLFAAILTVWLTDRIMHRLGIGITARLFAIALVSFSPIYLAYASIIRVDFIQSAANLATVLFCLRYCQQDRPRFDIALAGAFLGIAVASKYLGLAAAAPIIIAVGIRALQERTEIVTALSHVALAALASAAAAFIVSPYLFLDFSQVLADVAFEARNKHLSATSQGFLGTLGFYLSVLAAQTNWMSLLALLGCASLSQRKQAWPVLGFALTFLLAISLLSLRWERWLITLIPFLAILAGAGINLLLRLWGERKPLHAAVLILLCGGLTLHIVSGSTHAIARAADNDTRAMAEQWMLDNAPRSSAVVLETYAPALSGRDFQVVVAGNGKLESWASHSHFDRPPGFFGFGLSAAFGGDASQFLKAANGAQIDYVILSNWEDRYRTEGENAHADFYQEIRASLDPAASFRPNKHTLGPPVTIYRLQQP